MEMDGGLEKLTKMSDFLSHSEFVCKSKTYILYIYLNNNRFGNIDYR